LLIIRNTRGILHISTPASPSYKHFLYRFPLKACPPSVWRVYPPLVWRADFGNFLDTISTDLFGQHKVKTDAGSEAAYGRNGGMSMNL